MDEMLQVWAIHHLEIIGEAARGSSGEFRAARPNPVRSSAVGMRNILVHHYFEIDAPQVWLVVEKDLPELKKLLEKLLSTP